MKNWQHENAYCKNCEYYDSETKTCRNIMGSFASYERHVDENYYCIDWSEEPQGE